MNPLDDHVPNLDRMAKAICSAWPKDPDGCAAICMDRLGEFPPDGCRHAIAVHGDKAKKVLGAPPNGKYSEVNATSASPRKTR